MKETLKFVIQIAVIVFLGWFLIKFTTFDDKIVSFFRANSSLTGNIAVVTPDENGVASDGQGASCTTPWGETLSDGTYIIAYENPNSCKFEKRYCTNGMLDGSYSADHCNSPAGTTVHVTEVVKPVVTKIAYGYIQDRYAAPYQGPVTTNGNGNITVIGTWNNQKTNLTTIPANDSLYSNPAKWNYRNYDLTQHGCTTPWGSYIDSSASVIAYKTATPTSYGASCTYERRTCFQGVLGGSYRYKSCGNANNDNIYNNNGQDYRTNTKSCLTPWGSKIANGSRVYAYQSSYASSSYGCAGQYRTCSNGYLNGSYQYSSCTTHDNYDSYRCDLPRGGSIANGSSITAYNNSSSPCYSQTRTCTNGTLNGSYQYSSCTTVSHNSCSLPWGGSIADGSSVTAYSSSSSPCSSQTRTCNDGSLNGSYQYSSCSTIDNGGGQDSYGSRQSAGQKEGNVDSLDTCNANATSPYTCGSESNNSCVDYSKISCTSFSPMICTYQQRSVSCVR